MVRGGAAGGDSVGASEVLMIYYRCHIYMPGWM